MSLPYRRVRSQSALLLAAVVALVLVGVLPGFVLRSGSVLSPRFNHVMLYVSDLDASIAFYTEAFELEVTQRIDALTVVAPDGSETQIAVEMAFLRFPGQDFVFELSEQRPQADGPTTSYQHVGVDVVDIEAAADRALAAGAGDFSGIQTVSSASGVVARNAFFVGPDGELVELMEMVAGDF